MSHPLVLQTRRRGGRTVIVANPIKRGYSKPTVSANISELKRAGYPINQAVAISLRAARASWRERYPKRKFPEHLGAPRRQSWVDEHGTKRPKKKTVARRRRRNPTSQAEVDRAQADYERFHWGEEPQELVETAAPQVSPGDVLVELGTLEGVAYGASKSGEDAIWEHPFEDPKPTLASTEAGELVILGGGYTVNRRGIVG